MMGLSRMDEKRKLGRGLEEVSHLFLSGDPQPHDAKACTEKEVQVDTGQSSVLPYDTAEKEGLDEAVSTVRVKRNPPLVFVSSKSLLAKKPLLVNAFFIVPTIVRSEELLNSYLLIKQISQGMSCKEVGLLILEEDLPQKAEAAFRVITEMADKFLSCKIRLVGTIPKGEGLFLSVLGRAPLLPEAESPVSQSIGTLADRLIQENTHLKGINNGKDSL